MNGEESLLKQTLRYEEWKIKKEGLLRPIYIIIAYEPISSDKLDARGHLHIVGDWRAVQMLHRAEMEKDPFHHLHQFENLRHIPASPNQALLTVLCTISQTEVSGSIKSDRWLSPSLITFYGSKILNRDKIEVVLFKIVKKCVLLHTVFKISSRAWWVKLEISEMGSYSQHTKTSKLRRLTHTSELIWNSIRHWQTKILLSLNVCNGFCN